MGSAKKKVSKAIGGGGSKPKAPKVAPAVAPTVQGDSDYASQSQASTGRRAQAILDPMQAKEDENKEILG